MRSKECVLPDLHKHGVVLTLTGSLLQPHLHCKCQGCNNSIIKINNVNYLFICLYDGLEKRVPYRSKYDTRYYMLNRC